MLTVRHGVLALLVSAVLGGCAEPLPPLTHPAFTEERWEGDDAECSRNATLVRTGGWFRSPLFGRTDAENQLYYRCMVRRGYRPTIAEESRSASTRDASGGARPTGVGGPPEAEEGAAPKPPVSPSESIEPSEASAAAAGAASVTAEPGEANGAPAGGEAALTGPIEPPADTPGARASSESAEPPAEPPTPVAPSSPAGPLRWLDVPLEP